MNPKQHANILSILAAVARVCLFESRTVLAQEHVPIKTLNHKRKYDLPVRLYLFTPQWNKESAGVKRSALHC